MADPSLDSDNNNPMRVRPGSRPGMPRWVKMFGLVAVILVAALFVVLHLTGLGGMGSHH